MGDRFEMTLRCAYCGMSNEVWYAPTCGAYSFRCIVTVEKREVETDKIQGICNMGCGKINFICADFRVKKAEEVTDQDVIDAFETTSNGYYKPSAIKKEAKQYIRDLKKLIEEESKND